MVIVALTLAEEWGVGDRASASLEGDGTGIAARECEDRGTNVHVRGVRSARVSRPLPRSFRRRRPLRPPQPRTSGPPAKHNRNQTFLPTPLSSGDSVQDSDSTPKKDDFYLFFSIFFMSPTRLGGGSAPLRGLARRGLSFHFVPLHVRSLLRSSRERTPPRPTTTTTTTTPPTGKREQQNQLQKKRLLTC